MIGVKPPGLRTTRVTIIDVDLDPDNVFPVAVGRDEMSFGEIDIDLSIGTGANITVPVVGETWFVKLVGARWALDSKLDSAQAFAGGTPVAPRDGQPPTLSPTPTVQSGQGIMLVSWVPIVNFDPVIYEVYMSDQSGFTPTLSTKLGETAGTQFTAAHLANGGNLTIGETYFFKIIARDVDGQGPASPQASGHALPFHSDGVPPSASPTPSVINGTNYLNLTWTAITNADLVTYEVYGSATNNFTPGPANKIGETNGLQFFFDHLTNGSVLLSGTTYYVRIIAKDADGAAPQGNQASGSPTGSGGTDGDAPASSPTPVVESGFGYLNIHWPLIDNPDPVTYEVHLSDTAGFSTSSGTKLGETSGSQFFADHLPNGDPLVDGEFYYTRIIAKDVDGPATAGPEASGTTSAIPPPSDGAPPASSPQPFLIGGPRYILARWASVANADPVTYEVHVSTGNNFNPGSTTKVGETSATQWFIEYLQNGTTLSYGTTYYVRLIAKDVDGPATAGTQSAGGTLSQIGGTDIANSAVSASQIASGAVGTTQLATSAVDASKLADAAVTTAKLNDLAITTGKIAPLAIDSTKIGTGAVVAGKIAADAVTANEIAANAVTASEIAANAVTAGAIAAGSITTAKIAAGAVTATELAAGSVIAGKIAALSITAVELAAGAVRADKLVIGNFDNLAEDPGFELGGTSFVWGDGWTVQLDATNAHNGSRVARHAGSGSSVTDSIRQLGAADCKPGDEFYAEAWVKSTSGADGTSTVRIAWLDAAKAPLSYTPGANITPGTSWTLVSVIGTAPTGALYARIEVLASAHSTGNWYADDVYMKRRIITAFLSDAAITTAKIASAQITNALLDQASVNKIQVVSGSIVDLTATKITAGTITTSGIYVGSSQLELSGASTQIIVRDTQAIPINRVVIGQTGGTSTDYGIQVRDASGNLIVDVNGLGLSVVSDANIAVSANISGAKIASLSANKITAGTITSVVTVSGIISAPTDDTDPLNTGWRVVIGGATTPLKYWNGTTTKFSVDNAGNIVAVGLQSTNGVFSGSISSSVIQSSSLDIGAGNASFHVDTVGKIWSGSTSFASAPFSVDAAGNVIANNLTELTSGSGVITTTAIHSRNPSTGKGFHVSSGGNMGLGGTSAANGVFYVDGQTGDMTINGTATVGGSVTLGGAGSFRTADSGNRIVITANGAQDQLKFVCSVGTTIMKSISGGAALGSNPIIDLTGGYLRWFSNANGDSVLNSGNGSIHLPSLGTTGFPGFPSAGFKGAVLFVANGPNGLGLAVKITNGTTTTTHWIT